MSNKAPAKLSPQEQRVLDRLMLAKSMNYIPIVRELYGAAKDSARLPRLEHRKMQQHVGVIIARINKKRRKFVIVPGGKDAPRTYKLIRRR